MGELWGPDDVVPCTRPSPMDSSHFPGSSLWNNPGLACDLDNTSLEHYVLSEDFKCVFIRECWKDSNLPPLVETRGPPTSAS